MVQGAFCLTNLKAIPINIRTKENRKEHFAYERIIERTINGIKVTSHIPEDVRESFKRNRINQIYDILKPVEAEKDSTEKSGTDNNHTSNKMA